MKFAVIGNGFIAPKHIEAIQKNGGRLVAVADIDPEKEIKGIPFYTDYRDALDKVDAVSICTPNDSHVEIIREAAKRRLKIISEKPITFKPEEYEEMRKVPNLFGMLQLRHLPEWEEMFRAARTAQEAHLKVEIRRSRGYKNSWKGDPKRTGGLLVTIGCHYFDIVGQLFGYEGFDSWKNANELKGTGTLLYPAEKVNWSIEFTEEQESYERSITLDGRKFDLVQKSNLHIQVYEDFMYGRGTTMEDEEQVLNMISRI